MKTTESNININRLRSYANILTNSTFNAIVRNHRLDFVHAKILKYDRAFINKHTPSYSEYFSYLFDALATSYRNEYVYKNLIINKILLGRYSLTTTTALNEFHINNSIADLVLINGTSKVFEIKTELDKPDRLSTQINDYRKVFKHIYIVTHHSLQDKYLKILDHGIGLIVLTKQLSLRTVREAEINNSLDNSVIMKSLRKPEYINIIQKYYGSLPETTDFKFYSACKIMIQGIPSDELHELMTWELKKRVIKEQQIFASALVPHELKHICLCLDFDRKDYQRLDDILSRKIININ